MKVHSAVVHRIDKDQQSNEASLFVRDELLPINEQVHRLTDRVSGLYTRNTKAYGIFQKTAPWPDKLAEWSEPSTEYDFLALTKWAMDYLKDEISSVRLATGGHMYFAHYTANQEAFLLVVMLKQTAGLSFDENLRILNVSHVDLNSLHLAARINLSSWKLSGTSKANYVSFIAGRSNSEVRDYFVSFIGVDLKLDSQTETLTLVKLINAYAPSDLDDVRRRLHDYGTTKYENGEKMELNVIASLVDPGQPEDFLEFIEKQGEELQEEFPVHKPSLRRLVRFFGKDGTLSISFEASELDGRISYDAEARILRISNPPQSLHEALVLGKSTDG